MLFGIVVSIWVIVCIFLILLVLIQSDKGGGISSALGGGFSSATAMLGTQDTKNILTRATTICATLFMGLCIIISLILANFTNRGEEKSILKQRAQKQESFSPSSILQPGGGMPIESEKGQAQNGSQPGAAGQTGAQQQSAPLPIAPAPAQNAPAPEK